MAKFDRFLLFSASLGCQCSPLCSNGRKLRKSIKGRQAKGCELPPPAATVGLCWQQFKVGSKLLHVAKQTSQHPPSPNLCVSKIGTVMCDRERKISRKRQLNFLREPQGTQRYAETVFRPRPFCFFVVSKFRSRVSL